MKKKLVAVLLCMSMVATFVTGCGSKNVSGDDSKTKEESSTEETITEATVEDVKAASKDGNAVVLDARTQDAYAGWSTENNKLGGHIDGASGFSASWLTCAYNDNENDDDRTREERLEICMENKGIKDDTKVIVYDENGKDASAVADYLSKKGVKDVEVFDLGNWNEQLVKYENYQTILPPSVVKELLDGNTVDEVGHVNNLKILEFSWGTEEESGYLDGHVPTAIHINSDDVDDEDNLYILDNDDILIETMKNAGVTIDDTIVVTGAGLYSCHLAFILKYLGVENVYIMSGGINGWTDAGYEAETKSNTPEKVDDFGTDKPLNPEYIDTVDEVTELFKSEDAQVVDTRTYKEFTGESSGYSYRKEAGRPEGSIFGQEDGSEQGPNCTANSMIYYENIDGTMRDASEILKMWKNSKVDVSKHLSFYCGGGYRAAAVTWYAHAMGLENTSLYNDGWSGWTVNGKDAVKGTYENPEPSNYKEQ